MKEKINYKKEIKTSLNEASSSAIMSGAGDAYIVPYALALNASNAQIGFLSSFVGLFVAFSQLIGSKLTYFFSRKKLVVWSVLIQALMWMFLLFLGILYWKGFLANKIVLLVIVFYCAAAIAGSISGPAWFSWIGDLIDSKKRGDYFSQRNKLAGTIAMIITLIASFFLDYMEYLGFLILGFCILFLIAGFGRALSGHFLYQLHEPESSIDKKEHFTFLQFIKKAPFNNFGKFAIYVGLINIVTNFAAPFFAVYMLKELNFSYSWFIAVTLSGSLFTIFSMPIWGRIGDYYGNRKLLIIGSIIIPFAPLFWIFSSNPFFLIFSAQLVAGFGWAAFNLATSNFIYDSITPQKRAICVAYFTMINGIAIFLGAISGGFFAEKISVSFMNTFLLMFLISGVGRGLVAFIFLPKIKEVREIPENLERIPITDYAYLLAPRPLFGIFRGVRGFMINAAYVNSQTQSVLDEVGKNIRKLKK